jgi:integrase
LVIETIASLDISIFAIICEFDSKFFVYHPPMSDISCTPPEIREAANVAIQNLLPRKSRKRYEVVYEKFVHWCKDKKIKNYSENCLLAYFQDFSSKKSLWPTYSMLKSCLIIHENVDISTFKKLIAFLKRETEHQCRKKSKILEWEHIEKFIAEAPDSSFLLMKVLLHIIALYFIEYYILIQVVLIMGIAGACRREELCKMSIDDIEFKTDVVFVTVPETKNNVSCRFAVTEAVWIGLLLKYKELRNATNKRFFLTYRNGKCVNSPVGLNTFGKIPSKIAEYLHLDSPDQYTGHCFRRSSATLLVNHGGDLLTLKRHGGWLSSAVAESYVENSLHSKKMIADKIMKAGPSSATTSYDTPLQPGPSVSATDKSAEYINVAQSLSVANQAAPGTSISNCQNFTIHFYNNICESCESCKTKNIVNN